ncbi:MAG: helix-turn-helix transcriptional regulator [Clostridia bacterium]|nr:helix-turn-helix transcriptional regulator [Clostridia bacterium]
MAQKYYCRDFFDNNESVSVGFYMENREIKMHSHEFWEISYVYEGRGTHHFEDGTTRPICDGEFIFMSPGISHCITSPPPDRGSWVRVCNLLIMPDHIDALSKQLLSAHELDEYAMRSMILKQEPFCVQLKDDSGSVNNLLMTAAHEYKHPMDGSAMIIENAAMSLIVYIVRLYQRLLTNDAVTSTRNEVIDDLIRFIKSNFGSDLTLNFLAEYAHLSPEYLSRYFKKCAGMNISDFITQTRIEKAKYRLRTSSWSINDISEYCGYRSISNFQKAFKKSVGMTAGEYRLLNCRLSEI